MTHFLKQGTSGTYLAHAPRGSLCGARRDGVASLFTPRPPPSCGRLLTGPRPLASLRVDSRAARAWGGGAEQSGGCRRRGGSVGGRAPAPSSARQAACWAPSLRRRLPGRGRLGLTFPQECNCCEGPERLETRGPPPAARSAAHPVTQADVRAHARIQPVRGQAPARRHLHHSAHSHDLDRFHTF